MEGTRVFCPLASDASIPNQPTMCWGASPGGFLWWISLVVFPSMISYGHSKCFEWFAIWVVLD